MKLIVMIYTCDDCGHAFETPDVDPGSYGEFVLRTSTGHAAFLDALHDPTYEEADRMLAANPAISGYSAMKRADLLQAIFGEACCDRAEDGSVFSMTQHPICPRCKSAKIRSWDVKEPVEIVDVDMPTVSHRTWLGMNDKEREARLAESVDRALGRF
ncbi:hypothetical protein [Methylosinus sp. PW1]|uniref:hypothetical protein n=1 Tax=Methylosinus sp. PW1 TaxID=107636 RepID=UPI000562A945|nr:hypothetical protein [Methylosinus sp. PW1]